MDAVGYHLRPIGQGAPHVSLVALDFKYLDRLSDGNGLCSTGMQFQHGPQAPTALQQCGYREPTTLQWDGFL